MKFTIPALLGLLTWPILGPLVAVLVVAACYLRVSSLERLRSGGALDSPVLRPSLAVARILAWVSALVGSVVTLCIIHDAFGRWGQWMSPRSAISLAWMWTFVLWGEAVVATVFLRRASLLLEVGWLRYAAKIFGGLVIGGIAAAIVIMVLGSAVVFTRGTGIALLVTLIMLSWIPLAIGGWVVGACIQQVAGVAPELHWLASSGHGFIDGSREDGKMPEPPTLVHARRDGALSEPSRSNSAIGAPAAGASQRDDDPIPLD